MGNDRMTICRKIKLFPVGDKEEINRVYDFIRNGQYAQYQACNLLMGQLMSEYYKYNRDIKNKEFKARQKEIMTNSNIILKDIDFATGVDTPSAVTQKVKQDFSTALKNCKKCRRNNYCSKSCTRHNKRIRAEITCLVTDTMNKMTGGAMREIVDKTVNEIW